MAQKPKALNDNDASALPAHRFVQRPCPICAKPSTPETQPFCSKRCADVDLHRWLGGTYAIPVADESTDLPDGDDE